MNLTEPDPAVSAATGEWWRGAVIYQIYPRSFADSNGDGIGDLPGITAHLGYVASLGVDAIWLSPFFTSPMDDFGYDIADYRDVDPIFGTLADFDALLARAHDLGLKVIIDQVYAHTSDRHCWFQDSRSSRNNDKANWFVWADPKPDGSPPNNWQSVFHGPCWTWDARRGQYYLHNFLPSQPNLNGHNPAVQDALLETARFWLDRGVDGFRLDAINFSMHDPELRDNPARAVGDGKRTRPFDFQHHFFNQSHPAIPRFLERVREVMDGYGARFTVAEVGGEQADVEMKSFTEGHRRLDSAYGFNFLYADELTPSLIRSTLDLWPGAPDEGWPSWAFSNHDAPRVVSRWLGNRDDSDAFARQALLLLMALRGNVFLYQGEELGLTQAQVPFERLQDPEAVANWPETLGRDGSRTPMPWRGALPHAGFSSAEPWLPVDPEHLERSVDGQEANPSSILNFTRELILLRNRHPALRTGAVKALDVPSPLVAFERSDGQSTLLCLFNLGAETIDRPLDESWRILKQVGEPLAPLSGLIAERAA